MPWVSKLSLDDMKAAWDAIAAGSDLGEQAALYGVTRSHLGHYMNKHGIHVREALTENSRRRCLEAKELVRNGMTIKDACAAKGVSGTVVSVLCRDLDLGKQHRTRRGNVRRTWKMSDVRQVYNALVEGSTLEEQARFWHTSRLSLSQMLRRCGSPAIEAYKARRTMLVQKALVMIEAGCTVKEAAETYGLTDSYIYKSVQNSQFRYRKGKKPRPQKYTLPLMRQVFLMRQAGKSRKEVGEELGVDPAIITRLVGRYRQFLAT